MDYAASKEHEPSPELSLSCRHPGCTGLVSYGGQSVQLCALHWKFVVTLMLMVFALLCSCWERQCLEGHSLLCLRQHGSVVPCILSMFLKLFSM